MRFLRLNGRISTNLLFLGGVLLLGFVLPVHDAHALLGPLDWIFKGAVGSITNLLLVVPTFILVLIQNILGFFADHELPAGRP